MITQIIFKLFVIFSVFELLYLKTITVMYDMHIFLLIYVGNTNLIVASLKCKVITRPDTIFFKSLIIHQYTHTRT